MRKNSSELSGKLQPISSEKSNGTNQRRKEINEAMVQHSTNTNAHFNMDDNRIPVTQEIISRRIATKHEADTLH